MIEIDEMTFEKFLRELRVDYKAGTKMSGFKELAELTEIQQQIVDAIKRDGIRIIGSLKERRPSWANPERWV